jgi:hypothetical protein
MGMRTDMEIAGWQQASGIQPASGKRHEILEALQNACFEAIKILELEKSGIRDGAGFWIGSDVIGHVTQELAELCYRLRKCDEEGHD